MLNSPHVFSEPRGMKIGSHPKPSLPRGSGAITPSLELTKASNVCPSYKPNITETSADLSAYPSSNRHNPLVPSSIRNHLISGPGNLPSAQKRNAVSSTSTGDCTYLYASFALNSITSTKSSD